MTAARPTWLQALVIVAFVLHSSAPAVVRADGTAVVVGSDGRVWLVTDGVRHELASRAAEAGELDRYAEGARIGPDTVSVAGKMAVDLIASSPTPVATPAPSATQAPSAEGAPEVAIPTWSAGMPLVLGMSATSRTGGEPGATGDARVGPWRYQVTSVASPPAIAGKRPKGRWIVLGATLTNLSMAAGNAGDGREVRITDAQGRTYGPLYDVVYDVRRPLGLPLPYDPVWPGETFGTALAYDLPPDATGLRLALPVGAILDLDEALGAEARP